MLKILLKDDNESITEIMPKYLTGKGHDCTVSNGDDVKKSLTL